jgi:hypothetical protein
LKSRKTRQSGASGWPGSDPAPALCAWGLSVLIIQFTSPSVL